jgi:hypothetical protein
MIFEVAYGFHSFASWWKRRRQKLSGMRADKVGCSGRVRRVELDLVGNEEGEKEWLRFADNFNTSQPTNEDTLPSGDAERDGFDFPASAFGDVRHNMLPICR